MTKIELIKAETDEEIEAVYEISYRIWNECYPDIIGQAQVDYMLANTQSIKNIRENIQNGYEYYFITEDGKTAGYTSICREEKRLFLNNLYLLKEFRGHGTASGVFGLLKEMCRKYSLKSIWLKVNRGNSHAVAVYEHSGFTEKTPKVTDIGGGFVMDDYIMEMKL